MIFCKYYTLSKSINVEVSISYNYLPVNVDYQPNCGHNWFKTIYHTLEYIH